MAQLTSDSFALGAELLSVDDAVALIGTCVAPVAGTAIVSLTEADGRVLAQDIVAPLDLPPFDNAAVDGYAVRFDDLAPDAETSLAVEGRVTAGMAKEPPAAPGRAIRIFTGAPMPMGADTVFMQEDCKVEDGVVVLPPGLTRGANRRLRGEDVMRGSVVLEAGRRLTPQDIGLAAALGLDRLTLRRRPKVAIFSTGNEVVQPGRPLPPAGLYDSNRYMLGALLTRLGGRVTDLGILSDDRDIVAAALSAVASEHDLIVTSGGVSTGEEDHVRTAVESIGSLVFWRLAIKPGRPVAMGVVGTTPFIGLPGNPVAVFVTFVHVVRPVMAALSGTTMRALPALPVTADFSYRKKAGRREYVRVKLLRAQDGRVLARKHPREGAGVITSLTHTDGLVVLGEDVTQVHAGDSVEFLAYEMLI